MPSRDYEAELLRLCLQCDPPNCKALVRSGKSGYPPPLPPEAAAKKPRERMERLAKGMLIATGCRSCCSEITGPSRRGGLVGVMCRTCLLLRADFFAFRFVSDLRRRQPVATIREIFSDGSSETKWPLGSKRNALPKRAGKPPEGLRRNLRDTGGEKNVRNPGMASGKKNLRATGRAPVLSAVRRSGGGCRRMSPCPGPRGLRAEFPHPFCGSGPAVLPCVDGSCFARFF